LWCTRLLLLTLPAGSARLFWRTGLLLLALTIGRALFARTIVRRRRLLARTVRSRARLLPAGTILLSGLLRPRRIAVLRIGAAEGALLGDDLPADRLRRMKLTYKTLIARGLLRGDRQRHRGKARAANTTAKAAADCKAARALRQFA